MLRFLTIFLSIALLGNAGAATLGLYTYEINSDNGSVSITNYPTDAIGAIEIPATIDGRSVTSIGWVAFAGCTSLTSITIPNSVTSIGELAFNICSSLTSIIIPNSVTSIGGGTFAGCSSLTSIVVADDNPNYSSMGSLLLNKLGTELILGPGASGHITIPDSVTSIGWLAFSGCSSLTSITIPNSVTSIRDNAFLDCTGLTSITIPNSVTSIGGSTFSGCDSLTSIVVVDDNPNYSSMGSLLLNKPGTELIVGPGASGHITIPNSVTRIGDSAFRDCTALTSITIPNSVTRIERDAFGGCTGLTSITIPNSVTSIERGTFAGCSSLTSITIPNSVTSIEGGTFAGTFAGCSSLTSIVVADDNPNYSSMGSLLLNKPGTELIVGPGASGHITIPNSVTSIKDFAFGGCTGLTSINIPDSVTSIGDNAFRACTALTSITIPNSVTRIGDSAFADCTNLASIRLQSKVAPVMGPKQFLWRGGPETFARISATAMIHYRQGATGYEASYDGVPTLEDYFAYFTAGEVATAVATAIKQAQQDVIAAPASFSLQTMATVKAELIDMRTGSTMLNMVGSNAVLQLQIQRSDDLNTWTSSSDDLIEVKLPMQQGKGFYRFAMPQE